MGKSKDLASGAAYVETSGDTMTGDLGIGVAPAQPLHVFKAGSQGGGMAPLIKVQNDTNNLTGDGSGIEFHGKYQGGEWGFGKIGGTNSGSNFGGALEFHTNTGTGSVSTGFTKKMTIDRNGYVTIPNQPMISGTMGTAMTHPSNDTLLSFNVFFVSRGITFNSSTKRFTVPTAGVYSIMMTPFTYGGSGPHRLLIGINTDAPLYTSHKGHFYDNDTTTYASGALHSVVDLAANDYIVFRLLNGKLYNQSNDRFNEFSICKIA